MNNSSIAGSSSQPEHNKQKTSDPSKIFGPVYTSFQLKQYFTRIELPREWQGHEICTLPRQPGTLDHPQGLEFLRVLQGHQMSAVPFENLHIHYSLQHSVAIEPESVFKKIVTNDNGRGGYCMENNTLFLTVLRSLGYQVYPTGARVNSAVQPSGEATSERVFRGL